jgi:DNA polymerase III subunit epsilon
MSNNNDWSRRSFFCFDVESSGVNVDLDRIVTATVALITPGQPVDASTWMADPGIPIPAGASAVHGISTEQARAEGRPLGEVIPLIVERLNWAAAQGVPVIAFNAAYDCSMLDRACRRLGIPAPEPFIIDPSVLDRRLDKWRKGKRTLTATCEHYRVALNGAHDATEDALAAGRVAWRMAQLWPAELQIPLADLHTQQALWRFEWARDFQAYLRRKDPGAVVSGDWPVQTLPAFGWTPTAVPTVEEKATR